MTDAHATIPADAEALLRQAAAWRLIGLLLECPGPDWMKQVLALGRDCDDPRLQSAAVAAQTEASEGLHHSLFGPGGPVSPREVTYSGGVQFGYLMAELNAFYRAFAYAPTTMEPLDHLSVEAGFMAYLGMKRAYALASGDTEHATVTQEAASNFCSTHLALMVEPIARALEVGGPPYLVLVGQALYERVGPSPSRGLPLAESPNDGDECGA